MRRQCSRGRGQVHEIPFTIVLFTRVGPHRRHEQDGFGNFPIRVHKLRAEAAFVKNQDRLTRLGEKICALHKLCFQ